jgi:hypothetical protein
VHIGAGSGTIAGGGGGGCNGTFRDEFNSRNYSGNDGTLEWTNNWVEIGESDGPQSGDIQVRPDESDYQLQAKKDDRGVWREADLSGASSATLSYVYRRDLNDSGDYVAVAMRDGNTTDPWVELARYEGYANDSDYQSASHNIDAYISGQTLIQLKTGPNTGGAETVFFDDIQILCTP